LHWVLQKWVGLHSGRFLTKPSGHSEGSRLSLVAENKEQKKDQKCHSKQWLALPDTKKQERAFALRSRKTFKKLYKKLILFLRQTGVFGCTFGLKGLSKGIPTIQFHSLCKLIKPHSSTFCRRKYKITGKKII
jgi:hypothetical protein